MLSNARRAGDNLGLEEVLNEVRSVRDEVRKRFEDGKH
jgi:hypothetical protein